MLLECNKPPILLHLKLLGNLPLCHHQPLLGSEESLRESLERQLLCHSEGGRSPTEESLKESLVARVNFSGRFSPSRHDKNGESSVIQREILRPPLYAP
ncbi:hypothetical protein [Helicobacter marmotae]|uniref:hypothetical protein n=1 Tax=Helicobacter marmotae TaxID=152490 RepID=UPI0013159A02|nr:hypothetical protein [Helicobacter marmotae]